MTLSAPITIKTEAECRVDDEGSTTTSTTRDARYDLADVDVRRRRPPRPSASHNKKVAAAKPLGGNSLAFTGTDAINLALVGGAAALGGRALYGLARRSDDDDEDEE